MLLCLCVEIYEASAYFHHILRRGFHLKPAPISSSFLGWVWPLAMMQARPSCAVTLW